MCADNFALNLQTRRECLSLLIMSLFFLFLFFLIYGFHQPSNPSVEMLFISFVLLLEKSLFGCGGGKKMAKETEQEMCGCLSYFSFFIKCHSSLVHCLPVQCFWRDRTLCAI